MVSAFVRHVFHRSLKWHDDTLTLCSQLIDFENRSPGDAGRRGGRVDVGLLRHDAAD